MKLTQNYIQLNDLESCRLLLDKTDERLQEQAHDQTRAEVFRLRRFRPYLLKYSAASSGRASGLYESGVELPEGEGFDEIYKKFTAIRPDDASWEDILHFRLASDSAIELKFRHTEGLALASYFARAAVSSMMYASNLALDRSALAEKHRVDFVAEWAGTGFSERAHNTIRYANISRQAGVELQKSALLRAVFTPVAAQSEAI